MKTHRSGFTLLELLVVIAIIGIIATIIIASLGGANSKAKDSKAVSQLSSMRTQAELYRSTYGDFGPNATDCDAVGTLFTLDVPESLSTLIAGMPSGYTTSCYVDPNSWSISVESPEENKWCFDSRSDQIFFRGEVEPEIGTWCHARFYS